MPAKQQPLRTAMIGLSSTSTISWASNAHLPVYLSPSGLKKFQITALCNSSVDAAKAAVEKYKLPAATKTYGSPSDVAADPDIDLVVCNTRVDKHYATILPSIQAGKDVYLEWPLGATIEESRALADAAKKSGSRVAVGLQRRWAAPIVKMREILQSGKLGKIVSGDMKLYGGTTHRNTTIPKMLLHTQFEGGGNFLTIGFGHTIDMVMGILGDLDPKSVKMKMQLQRPEVQVKDLATGELLRTVISNSPDLLTMHGTIATSPYVQADATFSGLMRAGQPFPGDSPVTVNINCERGEMRFYSVSGTNLTFNDHNDARIQIHYHDDDRVETIPWTWKDYGDGALSGSPRSVQSMLYPFADGWVEGETWLGIEEAARKAEWIEEFAQQWRNGHKN